MNEFFKKAQTRNGESHTINEIIRNMKGKVVCLRGTIKIGDVQIEANWSASGKLLWLNHNQPSCIQKRDYSLFVVEPFN